MVWFKVDDQLAVHLKAVAAGNAAMGLWVRAGSWCAAQLTDGFVPASMVPALGGSDVDASDLADAGLWHADKGGWRFHDWEQYQPTREQVLAERSAAVERMRTVRANRKANVRRNGAANVRDLFASGSATPSPSPDSSKTSKSQSRNTRARVSTDPIQVPEVIRRLASQKGITSLRVIVDAIQRVAGRHTTAMEAYQVATWILDKAPEWPDAPQRYVTGSISKSALEVQQYIDEQGLGAES